MSIKKPASYMVCMNSTCAKAETCLRHRGFREISPETVSVRVLSPLRYPQGDDACAYYNSAAKVRVAWGIRGLLDNVPHNRVTAVRNALRAYFGRNKYYRIFRGELPLLPAEQDAIRDIFRENGIETSPAYDRFTEETCWSD